MAKELEYYRSMAQMMITGDAERDAAFEKYDEMYHGDWDLPKELDDVWWLRRVPTTDPHDAIEAGKRVLAGTAPKPKKIPLVSDELNRQAANRDEKNLEWQLKSANRRRQQSVQADIAQSALLYSAVAAQVIDLDWQIEQLTKADANTTRLKAARRYSRFVVVTHNPQNVHVRYSNFGPDAVLLAVKRRASEVKAEWGSLADELESLADQDATVSYYDYWDYDVRAVWIEAEDTETQVGGKTVKRTPEAETAATVIVILPPTEHKMTFLPWVALMGGSTLEQEEKDKYHPMLYILNQTDSWETQNIVRSINVSERILLAGYPRAVEQGASQDSTQIDRTDPSKPARVPIGNTLQPFPPPSPDTALADTDDRISAQIERSTLSRILMGADIPSGTAFAALNLATQTAVGALKPAKELTEKALAELFVLMLLWVEFTGNDLVAYGSDRRSDLGEAYIIEADTIDPDSLYIEVELTPDVPTDRIQRANAASIMTQWGYPREYALEDVGVSDPGAALELWYLERFKDAMFQMRLSQMVQQAQMEAQQAMMAQQQEAQARAQQEQAMMMQGQGFNPAMEGTPYGQVNPEETREYQTGQAAGGAPVAEGFYG